MTLCALSTTQMATAETAQVSVVSSMEKLRPDQKPQAGSQAIELFAARGDAENRQIILSAPKGGLGKVKITSSPLTGPDGATLTPETNKIGYVHIEHPIPDGFDEKGDYPDILYPLETFDLKEGLSQSIWYAVWVPLDAKPGVYQGKVTIEADEQAPITIPVSLRVFSTVIPRQSLLNTAFGYGPWNAEKPAYYGEAWKELEEDFLAEMLRYRMTPENNDIGGMLRSLGSTFKKGEDGKWTADWSRFDKEVTTRLEQGWTRFHLSLVPLPWWQPDENGMLKQVPNRWMEVTKPEQGEILRLLNDHLVEKGWASRFAYKCFDEPAINEENAAIIRELAEFLHQHAPDLRLLMITTDCREIQLAQDYPAYIWVPHLPNLDLFPGYAEFQAERQKVGEPAWFYICETRSFHPVSHPFADAGPIDRHGSSQRALGLLAWRNRLDGFLYWNVNEWDNRGGYLSPQNEYIGEGVLFYPDTENHGLPFASIRAALLRDGFEDYDLHYLLNEQIQRLQKQVDRLTLEHKEALAKAKYLLTPNQLVPNMREFNRESTPWESHHRAVLETLETLTGIEAELSEKKAS